MAGEADSGRLGLTLVCNERWAVAPQLHSMSVGPCACQLLDAAFGSKPVQSSAAQAPGCLPAPPPPACSVTKGQGASDPEKGYPARFFDFINATWPHRRGPHTTCKAAPQQSAVTCSPAGHTWLLLASRRAGWRAGGDAGCIAAGGHRAAGLQWYHAYLSAACASHAAIAVPHPPACAGITC